MRRVLFTAATFAAAAAPAAFAAPAPLTFPYVSGPVTIVGCSVAEDSRTRTVGANSLHLNYYVNASDRTLSSVTFRVRYGKKFVDVTDSGTFYVKAPVALRFDLFAGLPWAGPVPTACRVLTASFAKTSPATPAATDGSGALPSETATPQAPQTSSGAPGARAESIIVATTGWPLLRRFAASEK